MGTSRSHVVLLGPPGAGKGTQAGMLSEHLRVPHISTGDILRGEVQSGSVLGQQAKKLMDRGELVSDDLILGIVKERIEEADCKDGFILDGFPRSLAQASGMEELGAKMPPLVAVSLEVPVAEVIGRLSQRRTCRKCKSMAHQTFNPPKVEGVCDRCGGDLYQREDDKEDVIQARLGVYRRETGPLLSFYRDRGSLIQVNGTGSSKDVFGRLVAGLGGGS